MSTSDSPNIRRDGWTAERQLLFLDMLTRTNCVTKAARAAGMTRESAYRLRKRKDGALFAAAWDRALKGCALSVSKGHNIGMPSGARRKARLAVSRAIPPKVTKWRKCTDPRFDPLEELLRDFRADAV